MALSSSSLPPLRACSQALSAVSKGSASVRTLAMRLSASPRLIVPARRSALIWRALARRRSGDFDGAFADYDHAVALAPDYWRAYNGRATTHNAHGDFTLAISGLQRHDELGDMARTLEVFKNNGLEVEKMRAEQQATELDGTGEQQVEHQGHERELDERRAS